MPFGPFDIGGNVATQTSAGELTAPAAGVAQQNSFGNGIGSIFERALDIGTSFGEGILQLNLFDRLANRGLVQGAQQAPNPAQNATVPTVSSSAGSGLSRNDVILYGGIALVVLIVLALIVSWVRG